MYFFSHVSLKNVKIELAFFFLRILFFFFLVDKFASYVIFFLIKKKNLFEFHLNYFFLFMSSSSQPKIPTIYTQSFLVFHYFYYVIYNYYDLYLCTVLFKQVGCCSPVCAPPQCCPFFVITLLFYY